MMTERYNQLTEEIELLLAEPLPPPAEKHLRREKLRDLEYERVGELENCPPDKVRMQHAIDFALQHCPQRIFSYPLAQREKRTTTDVKHFLAVYGPVHLSPPTTLEALQKQREELKAPSALLRALKQEQK